MGQVDGVDGADRGAVRGPAARVGAEELVGDDVVHDAATDRAVDLGGDRHVEAGEAVEVVGGAVERIDDPADAAGAAAVGALLAEDPVVGAGAESSRLDQRLGGPVHLGDHVGAGGLGADLGPRRPSRRAAGPGRPGDPLGEGRAAARVARVGHRRPTLGSGRARSARRVDLRSDTVTRPTPEMRRAMAEAEVGDDGFGDDPTVARLEAAFAERVGKEASLFVPSGTMANQIALRLLGRPGTVVLVGRRQHVVGARRRRPGRNAAAQLVALDDADGTIDPTRWPGGSPTPGRLVRAVGGVRGGHPRRGGRPGVAARAAARGGGLGLPVHLDGARLWNAAVASGTTVAERAAPATTVTCCVSKGLGAPVGSLLAGPADLVATGRVERKRLGGGCARWGSSPPPGCSPSTGSSGSPTTTTGAAAGQGGGRAVAGRRRRGAGAHQHRPDRGR